MNNEENINQKRRATDKDIFLFPLLFLIVTFGLFIPVSLFLGNIDEFLIPASGIIPSVAIGSLFLGFAGFVIAYLIREQNILDRLGVGLVCLALGFYVQGNFLNPIFEVLNGTKINWQDYTKITIKSSLCWLLIFIIPQVLLVYKNKRLRIIVKSISAFLSAVQIITLVVLLLTETVNNSV